MVKMKSKYLLLISIFPLALSSCNKKTIKDIPSPEISPGYIGEMFELDKNVNIETIDSYLGIDGVTYRDMRMLEDPIHYDEMQGGDRFLSGYINGFTVSPLPYILPVTNPQGIGGIPYSGPTLYSITGDVYIPNYAESESIINTFFPKENVTFLMCGGGGYAFEMKKLLRYLGYDNNKLYNVGGYWSYRGKNAISTVLGKNPQTGETMYDFTKVPYLKIDFDSLHAIN